ncbi:MAG: NAD(P)/FAD-dependent oxidoreductase [Chloroflexi bacterium]|nr:NAD(P)/FAD-dependent oxidoreductase [Chloroflexota bacterium]
MSDQHDKQVVIIGAGPAGLTAAYELTKHRIHPIILEQRDKVGGLARTENYKGYYFDMGGHRFFTKAAAVSQMWHAVLGDDFRLRPRTSRIYYQNKFFNYPLKPFNALFGLGIWEALLIGLSFIQCQIFPYPREDTFEQWVTNRFGKRLFGIFFKTYTEKVWGISTSELKAEWAAQRIKDLSLKTALLSMFVKPKDRIKTLIEEFHYPRRGPGMLWEAVRRQIEERGGVVELNSDVVKINRAENRITSVVVSCEDKETEIIAGTDFISSMPVSEFVKRLDPAPPGILQAAQKLHYRDFLTVCLIVNQPDLFPDNWIYIHSPEVQVGRIQNFKNWSADMVPDPSKTSLGLEYFCSEGDDLWNMSDADLIALGKREIERTGLARARDVEDGCVFRVPKAYPVYDSDYRDYVALIRNFVDGLENFQTIGRNGLHRYDNQDHAMMTGMLAVRNLVLGEQNDLWAVNTDQEYQEEIRAGESSESDVSHVFEGALRRVFSRLDPVAFGLAIGITAGLVLLFATLALVIKDGAVVGPNLQLLNQFFPGYAVDAQGSLVGFVYALVAGFGVGWGFAYLRNVAVYVSARVIHRDIELRLLRRFLDYL